MERKTYLTICCSLLCALLHANQYEKVYDAFVFDKMEEWKSLINQPPQEVSKLAYINYLYGYTGWLMTQDDDDQAEELIEKLLAALEEQKYKSLDLATYYAYRSAVVGYKIVMAPYKAPFIGGKSTDFAKKSVALDSTNTMGLTQLANNYYYSPRIFGGSYTKSLYYYQKAVEHTPLHERDRNWNYTSLLISICLNYIQLEDKDNAEYAYQRVLESAPEIKWFKKEYQQLIQENFNHE